MELLEKRSLGNKEGAETFRIISYKFPGFWVFGRG
jgi:hypothetical protein